MATAVDDAVLSTIMTGMSKEAAAAADRRTGRFDQLAADSAAMWGMHMTTPSVMMGMGFRTMQQSAGYPANTGTGTGGTS